MSKKPKSLKIITRAEARKRGLKRYFTGKTCERGHINERYVSCRQCIECSKKISSQYRAENKENLRVHQMLWRAENKEKCRVYYARSHAKNKEKRRACSARYRAENKEKVRASAARYRTIGSANPRGEV